VSGDPARETRAVIETQAAQLGQPHLSESQGRLGPADNVTYLEEIRNAIRSQAISLNQAILTLH
jgi:hypothetical protein